MYQAQENVKSVGRLVIAPVWDRTVNAVHFYHLFVNILKQNHIYIHQKKGIIVGCSGFYRYIKEDNLGYIPNYHVEYIPLFAI